MLDDKFWKNYMRVFDVMNMAIPYQELLEKVCQELEIKKGFSLAKLFGIEKGSKEEKEFQEGLNSIIESSKQILNQIYRHPLVLLKKIKNTRKTICWNFPTNMPVLT